MEYRTTFGEDITGDSWLMRDIWQKTHHRYSHRIGLAKQPKQLKSTEIKNKISQLWQTVGVRKQLREGQKRHEFKTVYGFRKFYESTCQLVMNHNNIKILMDHALGESGNYHRPTEQQLKEDYLNAVPLLTINEEERLKLENIDLKKETQNKDYLLQNQVFERDEQIKELLEKNQKYDVLLQDWQKDVRNEIGKLQEDMNKYRKASARLLRTQQQEDEIFKEQEEKQTNVINLIDFIMGKVFDYLKIPKDKEPEIHRQVLEFARKCGIDIKLDDK